MPYRIDFLPRARHELAKLPRIVGERIACAIDDLEYDPRPHGCKKLINRDAWRIRIGDYRVIYQIHDNRLLVLVVRIGHRRDIYD
jgi:mRNA interferase RelE/StbE